MAEHVWLANAIDRVDQKLRDTTDEESREKLRRKREEFIERASCIERVHEAQRTEAARIAEEERQDWIRREDGKSKAGGYGCLASNFSCIGRG
jgi:hypothetical protein